MTKAIWYPVPGWEGAFVNRLGEVGRAVQDRIVLVFGFMNEHGYKLCSFNSKTVGQHVLVTLTFHGPKPTPKHEVNHKNKDRADNLPGNLEWVTKRQNTEHRWTVEGTPWRKHKVAKRRLTDAQTRELILDSIAMNPDQLKEKYKVPKYFIRQLLGAHRQGGKREHKLISVKYLHEEGTAEQRAEYRKSNPK